MTHLSRRRRSQGNLARHRCPASKSRYNLGNPRPPPLFV